MNSAILVLLELLPTVIKTLTDSEAIDKIVDWMVEAAPVLVKEIADTAPFFKNIISALQDNDAITDAQWDELDLLSAKVDAEFEAAAKAALAEDRGD